MNKKIKKIFIIFLVILAIAGVFFLVWKTTDSQNSEEINFDKMNSDSDLEKGKEFIGNVPKEAQMIIIDSPKANEIINSPLKIKGEARGTWFFEASFPVRLVDENGKVLATGIAEALSDWMTTEFVPFELEMEFDSGLSSEGTLIFEKENPSDLAENADSYSLPVFFRNGEETSVKVYFSNTKSDPDQKNCQVVYAVNRKVPKVQKIGQKAIEELLKGPTDEEKEKGYFSSIQEGTEMNGLSIQHGVAFVDFNEKLDEGVGGSCKVSAIRSQIEQTLKQFPTVKEVQIYVGERSEDVLQP